MVKMERLITFDKENNDVQILFDELKIEDILNLDSVITDVFMYGWDLSRNNPEMERPIVISSYDVEDTSEHQS